MERLRIRFLYRRGDRVGYGPRRMPCTVLGQCYQTDHQQSPLISYHLDDGDGTRFWAEEADLRPLRGSTG